MPGKTPFYIKWSQKIKGLSRTTQILILLACLAIVFLLAGLVAGPVKNPDNSITSMGIDITLKLGAVILLIYIGAYFLRRYGFGGVLGKTKSQIKLQETLPLSPRRALYLVQVGKQSLLIGATDQSITLLTKIENDGDIEAAAQPAVQFADSFSDALKKYNDSEQN